MAFETFEIQAMEAGHKTAKTTGTAKVATWQSTSIVLIAEVIGVGVLSLPYVFLKLGWVTAFLGLTILCLGNMYAQFLLHRLFLQFPWVTKFSDFGSLVGTYTGLTAGISANMMAAGMATMDFLVAAQSLQAVIAAAGDHIGLVYCSLVVLVFMVPVVQIRSLHGLVKVTVVGVATIALPVCITLVKLCQSDSISDTTTVWPVETSLSETVAPLFTIVFAYFGSVVQVQLQSEMKRPQDYCKVIWSTSAIFFIVYSVVCIIVYAYEGSLTQPNLTEQLQHDALLRGIVNGMLFVHACVALSINMCVVNTVLAEVSTSAFRGNRDSASSTSSNVMTVDIATDPSAKRPSKLQVEQAQLATALEAQATPSRPSNLVWFGVSSLMLLAVWVISNSLPSLSGLIDVLSASAGMVMLYILPIIFALSLLQKVSKCERNLLWVLLFATAVFSVVAIYATISVLVTDLSHSDSGVWKFS